MKTIDQVRCCFVDTGLYMNMARTLGRSCDLVLYHNPDQRAWPSMHQACIGDGFPELHVVRDFWRYLDDIDLFVYPDVGRGAEQQYLRSIGKPVWGSARGEDLELKREMFMEVLGYLGLKVPECHVCHGLRELTDHLRDKEDQYIKLSRFRGDMETHHWRSFSMDEDWLDGLAIRFGPLKNRMAFLVFPAIEADIEIGADTYNILGQWPGIMLNGVEGKDKSYIAAVTPRDKMPEQLGDMMEAFSSVLRQFKFQGLWSSELRVASDAYYFIDPTCRGGMPSSGSQQLLWKNFSDIVWHGANGLLLEPEPAGKFSMETMITVNEFEGEWASMDLDQELEGIAQMNTCCHVNGVYAFPKRDHGGNDIGWLVSVGNTAAEVLEKQKEAADLLPDGFNADVESMASVLQDIDKGEEVGVRLTQQELPEPAEVL